MTSSAIQNSASTHGRFLGNSPDHAAMVTLQAVPDDQQLTRQITCGLRSCLFVWLVVYEEPRFPASEKAASELIEREYVECREF
jgi:hypothetical protein